MTLKYRVRILPDALLDVKAIYQWIGQESPGAAEQWLNGLLTVVDSLEQMPLRCPRAPESAVLGMEIRHYLYNRNYRVLYTVTEDVVRIHHIRHTSRQWMTEEEFKE